MHKSYRQVQSCSTCKFVFALSEYDEETEFYCTYKAQKRPLCGSNFMAERFNSIPIESSKKEEKKIISGMSAWEKWRKNRQVKGNCICDCYRRKSCSQ